MPLEENIGVYNFRVVATDSGGETKHDTLVIAIRQLASSRTFHHEFQATFGMMNRDRWKHPIEWKFELLENIVDFFGDADPGKITVLEMSETTPGQIRFRWTNDSLPRQSCPKVTLDATCKNLRFSIIPGRGDESVSKDESR